MVVVLIFALIDNSHDSLQVCLIEGIGPLHDPEWNKLCWDANNAVGLPKQSKVGLDWQERVPLF